LITLDTTRADRLGAYGNTVGATPNLDRLAAEGVTFRRAFCHTPLTIPSHVTIFTGQYPDTHGVRDNGDHFLSDNVVTLAERFKRAGYSTAASVGAYVTNHKWGFGQGFDAYHDHIPANYELTGNMWQSERRGDAVVADMVEWMESNGDSTFFAWVHLFDPHHPYAPPPPYDEMFPKRPYLGEIAYTDAQVGALIEMMENKGLLDDTTVLVVGDHGESFGNHKEHQHGLFVYNATMHVPFILRPAGGAAPRVVEEPVGLIDVAPTLLAVAGIEADAETSKFEGIDLSGALQGTQPPRRQLYGESMYVRYHFGWSEQRMVVEWPHKYIQSTRPELFDISDDPREKENLLDAQPDVAQRCASFIGSRPVTDVGGSAATVDPDTAARLEALGYVATRVEVEEGVELPDPKDKAGLLAKASRANMALRTGDLSEARTLFEEVVAGEPGLIDHRVMLAQVCARQGDTEQALAHLEEVDRIAPGKSNAMVLHAGILASTGRLDDALQKMEQVLTIDDQQPRAWVRLLQIHFDHRQYDEVAEAAERAEAALPGVPAVAGYHGAALVAMGRGDEARPLLNEALAGGNNPPWANFALAVLADEEGDDDTALTFFLTEHVHFPEHLPALFATVVKLEELGKFDDTLEYAQMARTADSNNIEMQRAFAQALFNLGRYDESHEECQRCLMIDTEHPGCTMLLANVLAKQDRRSEAEEMFQRAIELGRDQAPPGTKVDGARHF